MAKKVISWNSFRELVKELVKKIVKDGKIVSENI